MEFFTIFEKKVTVEEINSTIIAASNESHGHTVVGTAYGDIIDSGYGSLFDAPQTKIIIASDRQSVKTVA